MVMHPTFSPQTHFGLKHLTHPIPIPRTLTHKQNEDDEEENNNKPTTHHTLFVCVCASMLNFKLGPSSKVFLFSKTFRVVYYTLDSCMHTHMYSSPVGFLVVLRHVSSGYIFVITIVVVAADVVVRACRITSKFALQIPLLPLLLGPVLLLLLPLLVFSCSKGLALFLKYYMASRNKNRTNILLLQ